MSFPTDTLSLHRSVRAWYLSLPTTPHCLVTYVWLNPQGTTPKSKTRTLDNEPRNIQDIPQWYGTYNLNMVPFELKLVPVRMFRDPFSLDPHKLVLCEAREMDGTPAMGNRREQCLQAMEAAEDHKPWFGFEQEYLLKTLEGLPLGWTSTTPPSVVSSAELGLDKVYGRDVCNSHCHACLYAGVRLAGTTAEGLPSQWEFQVGPCGGVELGDHVWMARYILHRVCEDFGVIPSFQPKPVEHPFWANGGHMNFSTENMRGDGGLKHIQAAIERLSQRHPEDMWMYGSEENKQRLNNVGPNPDFSTFSWAVAERKCSVRIPGHVHQDGKGYLEDRRPAADCDPYQVSKALVQTCCRL